MYLVTYRSKKLWFAETDKKAPKSVRLHSSVKTLNSMLKILKSSEDEKHIPEKL